MTDLSNDQPMEPAVFDRGNGARRSTVHRKTGTGAKNGQIQGGTVCATHGGRARQGEKAQRRLAEAADSLAKQLLGIASDENASESVRLAAIKDALDRSGVSAKRRWRSKSGRRSGLLAHVAKPKSRSQLRVREPRRLPRGLSREESAALLGSFRCWRDRAIGGLMLRSAEVLGLRVSDVDIARRRICTGCGNTLKRSRQSRRRRTPRCPACPPTGLPSNLRAWPRWN